MAGRGGIKKLDREVVSQAIENVLTSISIKKEYRKKEIYSLKKQKEIFLDLQKVLRMAGCLK